ncbi:uncharacterized protein LOC129901745 isoform X2 [Solanum dulcamara]|uniref:uncharacterized protein LOC129901745 isoform X2 n=1 Tax=Solanum dulcamara TaxID=45834 RepID=UPI002486487E|nr:uncharacterized protein LOC129901745 isoform X2 [Solanum dulcamara]
MSLALMAASKLCSKILFVPLCLWMLSCCCLCWNGLCSCSSGYPPVLEDLMLRILIGAYCMVCVCEVPQDGEFDIPFPHDLEVYSVCNILLGLVLFAVSRSTVSGFPTAVAMEKTASLTKKFEDSSGKLIHMRSLPLD